MMMSPETYVMKYENASYFELLKLKNELVQEIAEFENDIEMKNPEWGINPSPDVHYQWNLEVLSKISAMLQEAFNKEYILGEKNNTDYYKEMKEHGE